MTWIIVMALAAAALIAIALPWRSARSLWQAPAAALLLGLTGYALQGRPNLAGAPHPEVAPDMADPGGEIRSRQMLAGADDQNDRYMVIADALSRHGSFADAATVLAGAVEKEPKNAQAWLAMANALASHAGGQLSPAAMLAYRRAAEADPAAPGPAFFLGLAMARAGRFAETRALWANLLAHAPADAPWRPDMEKRLAILDQIMAGRMPGQEQGPGQGQGAPVTPETR